MLQKVIQLNKQVNQYGFYVWMMEISLFFVFLYIFFIFSFIEFQIY